ncbi:hypothetical protein DKT77_15605 [Meridianimarinicoccus roseus]|uniref:Peroxidase n=1 Tax=Meridianimarinicoccus roseus TaxID=2072018 RepID=A0A2V2LI70_9RHOB|nr:peroxidase family protein [Meridianimarinicoccus roseus]PWR01563.1 hypothetical protein DKT77_15605 [Meridianimarinicoccus roseus]
MVLLTSARLGMCMAAMIAAVAAPPAVTAATLPAAVLSAGALGVTGPPISATKPLVPLVRLAPSDYADGAGTLAGPGRPNARSLSNLLSQPGYRARDATPLSNMAVAMFQFIASHEIAHTPTDGAEPSPIAIEDPADPLLESGQTDIAMDRARFVGGTSSDDPRQQLDQVTNAFDGSTVYGSSLDRQAELRSLTGGRMKIGAGGDVPIINGMPAAGDMRADENPSLRALHALFLREHNRLADEIAAACPSCTDQEIFDRARVMVANLQHKIFYDELLPLFLGPGPLDGHLPDPTVLQGVAQAINEFSTASGRIGHTQVPEVIVTGAPGGPLTETTLDACFFTASCLDPATQAERLFGLTQQAGEPVDTVVTDSLRNNQIPAAGTLFPIDLFATNIERGRDHGLADYESVRTALGFASVELDLLLPQYILEAYAGQPDGIDLIVGLFGEFRSPGSYLGETGRALWALQFRNIAGLTLGFQDAAAQAALDDWLSGMTMSALLNRDTGYAPSAWGQTPFLAPLPPSNVPLPPSVAFLALGLAALLRAVRPA